MSRLVMERTPSSCFGPRGDLLLQCSGLQIDSVPILSYFRPAVVVTAANGFPLHTPAGEFVQPVRLRQCLRRTRLSNPDILCHSFLGGRSGGKSMGFATDAIHVG